MGQDKALLGTPEGPLLAVLVKRLLSTGVEPWILARKEQVLPGLPPETRRIDDEGQGPLAAVAGALEEVATPWALVMACDHPLWNGPLLHRMLDVEGPEPVRIARLDGEAQPMHTLLRPTLADALATAIRSGERSPRRAFLSLPHRCVDAETPAERDALLDADDEPTFQALLRHWITDARG